ncbi:MAG: antibiotic biosynthesis monooxygenase [Rhizobium sp.]|nr:antibiotic biosynthesis monooxygenase [Rhizobium sp.]
MYGLIGKFRSVPGKRDELIAIMKSGSVKMPGCLSYVIAKDPADADVLWITEVWTDKDSHAASLKIPEVGETIKKAMPLIAGFDQHIETEPVDIA